MKIKIKATKDLYNEGLCFKKDGIYEIEADVLLVEKYQLENKTATNEQGKPHRIGLWYRHFRILSA